MKQNSEYHMLDVGILRHIEHNKAILLLMELNYTRNEIINSVSETNFSKPQRKKKHFNLTIVRQKQRPKKKCNRTLLK